MKSLLCQVLYTRSCDAASFCHVFLSLRCSFPNCVDETTVAFCELTTTKTYLPDISQLIPPQCDENKPSCDKCTRYNTPCSFLTLQPSRPSLDQPKSSSQSNSSFPSSQPSSRASPYPLNSVVPQNPKEHPLFSMMDLEFLHHCMFSLIAFALSSFFRVFLLCREASADDGFVGKKMLKFINSVLRNRILLGHLTTLSPLQTQDVF